ncbi:MAG: hypothetical protein M1832_006131 [Thelocarpon impressellum]|nr:MAG: hypothetical protein M1832_006131 [Thelocarpon impressellum]
MGARCRFLHHPTEPPGVACQAPTGAASDSSAGRPSRAELGRSRVVQKPVPDAQTSDPRAFQIQQLRRRFGPRETEDASGTHLSLRLVPSDPDFPFEIGSLHCVLSVPSGFPSDGTPALSVTNKDIPRGHQVNVERGFDGLVERTPAATLLGLMTALDRNLDAFLAEERRDTFKLVLPTVPRTEGPLAPPASAAPHSPDQLSTAKTKRENETRQLEARLGRHALFQKSTDGLAYVLPLAPRRRADLPVPLQAVGSLRLSVPPLYALQPCRIELLAVGRDAAAATERAFEARASAFPDTTLMGHLNYLAQNMHTMATAEPEPEPDEPAAVAAPARPAAADDKSHVVLIPRPPEWLLVSSGDEGSDYLSSSDDASEAEEDVPELPSKPQRGTALSLPMLELYGIELLELVSLALTVRCERCKQHVDVERADDGKVVAVDCGKCASPLNVAYRKEMLHAHSTRAGFLDLDGCAAVDLLPRWSPSAPRSPPCSSLRSHFIPTCAACSTRFPGPGLVSVRGDTSTDFCRECHRQMSTAAAAVDSRR